MRKILIFLLVCVSAGSSAAEAKNFSPQRLWSCEAINGFPQGALREDDALRNSKSYALGGDLMEQFVRLFFPITGRERRTMFLPISFWGPKKPQYKLFDWHQFESDHFNFYTYPEAEHVLPKLMQFMEEEHERNNRVFHVENRFTKKIPVIFYLGRRDFEQSSVIQGAIPESLAGLTELFSWKRATFPYEGEDAELEHVVKHEGTHIYQIARDAKRLPLWFIEGSAETNSVRWDAQAEITIRDAYLNGFFFHIQELWQIEGTWLMYKIGNFITNLIWDEYGEKGFRKIYDRAATLSFEDNLKESLGITVEELDQKVFAALANRYGALLKEKDIVDEAKKLEKEKKLLHARGRVMLEGGEVGEGLSLYLSYVNPDGKITKKRIASDRRFHNESLNYFRKGAWLDDQRLVYAIRRSKEDVIRVRSYSVNEKKRKISLGAEVEVEIPGVDTLDHPVLIGDQEVAFIGVKKGFTDIYKFNWKTKELIQLTDDQKHVTDLEYSKVRNELFFSREDGRLSDRLEYDRNLYSVSLTDRKLVQRTKTLDQRELQPRVSLDGKTLIYTSDKNGTYDVFQMDLESNVVRPVSRAKVGIQNPNWGWSDTLLFNGYKETASSVYVAKMPNLGVQVANSQSQESIREVAFKNGNWMPVSTKSSTQESPELAEDGFSIVGEKPFVRWRSLSYRVDEAALLSDRIVLKASKYRGESEPRFFILNGKDIESVESATYGQRLEAEQFSETLRAKTGIRAPIAGWSAIDQKRVLWMLNNRVAKKEGLYKKLNDVSLVYWNEETGEFWDWDDSSIEEVSDRIQWVVFLNETNVLLVQSKEKKGPYSLKVLNFKRKKEVDIGSSETLQFRVAADRAHVLWREGGAIFVSSVDELANIDSKRIKKIPGRVIAMEWVEEKFVSVLSQDGDDWVSSQFNVDESLARSEKLDHEKSDRLIRGVISTQNGDVILQIQNKNEQTEKLVRWTWEGRKTETLKTSATHYVPASYTKGYFFFDVSQGVPNPNLSYVLHNDEINRFAKISRVVEVGRGRLVIEQNENLSFYDIDQRKSSVLAPVSRGFTKVGNEIVASVQREKSFRLCRFLDSRSDTENCTKGIGDDVEPQAAGDRIYWIHHEGDRSTLRESLISKPEKFEEHELAGFDVVGSKKLSDDVLLKVAMKQRAEARNLMIAQGPQKSLSYERESAQRSLKLQSLTAAAAYDGDAIRYFVSAYADNLFSDRGVFVDSVFVGSTNFATVGYANVENGHLYSAFYSDRDSIRNGGAQISKSFVLDRYREWTPNVSFEVQDYGLATSETADYVPPDIENKTFYIGKVGFTYAYDVTLWDTHGPTSGSRFFFRGEGGVDATHGTLANADASIDFRMYNRVLPRFGFAHRLVAGTSQGKLPSVYLLGGNMTFRGVGFDDLRGQNFWAFSEDVRIPVFDFIGAKFFDPADQILGLFTRYFDVRGGIYADVGSTWFNGQNVNVLYSIGYFVNVPTLLGVQFRFNQGFAGKKAVGIWLGVNW